MEERPRLGVTLSGRGETRERKSVSFSFSSAELLELPIQRNKKGGAILMATHFMDQAALSLLGDRIALMAEDSGVAMLGSSLF
jgi:hypothetical protein